MSSPTPAPAGQSTSRPSRVGTLQTLYRAVEDLVALVSGSYERPWTWDESRRFDELNLLVSGLMSAVQLPWPRLPIVVSPLRTHGLTQLPVLAGWAPIPPPPGAIVPSGGPARQWADGWRAVLVAVEFLLAEAEAEAQARAAESLDGGKGDCPEGVPAPNNLETAPTAGGTGARRDQEGTGQADEWIWAPEGDGYRIAGPGERGHLTRLKGLAVIHRLVQSPGQPVPMVLLAGGATEESDNDRRSKQPAMDAEALRDAYTRCAALWSEIEQAEAEGRATEAAESRAELEQLQGCIKTALGVRGR
jgi:hypothetical protein